MGSKSAPQINYNPPPIPAPPTIGEQYRDITGLGREEFPFGYTARESALADIETPEKAQEYYSGYQPLDFEQVLANQFFQNIMPDIERSTKHNLSLSGMAHSPALADLIGRRRGEVGLQAGQFLSTQANQRAGQNLVSRLGIDPNQYITPYFEASTQRERDIMSANLKQQEMQAQIEIANAIQKAQEQSNSGLFGALGGAGLGALAAPFTMGLSLLPAIGAGAGIGNLAGKGFGGDAIGIFDILGGLMGASGLGGITGFGMPGAGASAGIGGTGGIASQGMPQLVNQSAGNIGGSLNFAGNNIDDLLGSVGQGFAPLPSFGSGSFFNSGVAGLGGRR